MKSRKAWLRILEAIIGVLIILTSLIFFISQQVKARRESEKIHEFLNLILDGIEKNQTLRRYIINQHNDGIANYVSSQFELFKLPYNFTFCISEASLNCASPYPYILPSKKEIFSESRLIIFLNNGKITSRKFSLFLWKNAN